MPDVFRIRESEEPVICSSFLQSTCSAPLGRCSRHHLPSTYQWQWYDDQQYVWKNLPLLHNQNLEQRYCDPKCEGGDVELPVKRGDSITSTTYRVDFLDQDRPSGNIMNATPAQEHAASDEQPQTDGDTLQTSSSSCTGSVSVRRLSTQSSCSSAAAATYDPCATHWVWYTQKDDNPTHKRWQPFLGPTLVMSRTLELSYADNPHATLHHTDTTGRQYHISLAEMSVAVPELHVNLELRRRPRGPSGCSGQAVPPPSQWQPVTLACELHPEYDLFVVPPGSQEYFTLLTRMGVPPQPNTRVLRVQNHRLWAHYQRYKYSLPPDRGNNEKLLFHGTSVANMSSICSGGFDPSRAGEKHGSAMGRGTYFATTVAMAQGYTQDNFIVAVQVIVGKACLGSGYLTRPPDPTADTCVDNQQTPTKYCTFSSAQAYPMYIISYT